MCQFIPIHDVRLHRMVTVVTKISFPWWWVYVDQHVYFSSVLPNQHSQTSLHFYLYVSTFQFKFFQSKVRGYVFSIWAYRTTWVYFPCYLKVLAMKKKSTNNLCPMPSTQRINCLKSCLCCRHVISGIVCILTQVYAHIRHVILFITQFVNFYAKTLVSLEYTTCK
jgi:hypothetical protein